MAAQSLHFNAVARCVLQQQLKGSNGGRCGRVIDRTSSVLRTSSNREPTAFDFLSHILVV